MTETWMYTVMATVGKARLEYNKATNREIYRNILKERRQCIRAQIMYLQRPPPVVQLLLAGSGGSHDRKKYSECKRPALHGERITMHCSS